jgi:ribosomal protein S14
MNWIINNKKWRILFKKNEIKKLILKSLLYNKDYLFKFKLYYDKVYKKFKYCTSIAKLQTFCLILKNKKSIFRKFKLSRHTIKKYASNGYIIGLKKASF